MATLDAGPGDLVLLDAELEALSLEDLNLTGRNAHGLQLVDSQLRSTDLTEATLSRARLRDVVTFTGSEMRGCDLSSAHSPERLRGVRMPWSDVIRTAAELASGIGIEVVDE